MKLLKRQTLFVLADGVMFLQPNQALKYMSYKQVYWRLRDYRPVSIRGAVSELIVNGYLSKITRGREVRFRLTKVGLEQLASFFPVVIFGKKKWDLSWRLVIFGSGVASLKKTRKDQWENIENSRNSNEMSKRNLAGNQRQLSEMNERNRLRSQKQKNDESNGKQLRSQSGENHGKRLSNQRQLSEMGEGNQLRSQRNQSEESDGKQIRNQSEESDGKRLSNQRQLRRFLGELGFRKIEKGVYVSPFAVSANLTKKLVAMKMITAVRVLETKRLIMGDDGEFAREVWKLDTIYNKYKSLISRLERLLYRVQRAKRLTDRLKTDFSNSLFSWYFLMFDDPGLPKQLLSSDWPHLEARKLVAKLTKSVRELERDESFG